VVDREVVAQALGNRFADNFVFLPAVGVKGGILLAADEDFFRVTLLDRGSFSVTARISARAGMVDWCLTAVYGPQEDQEKLLFLGELRWMKQVASEKWLLIGDFNLILQARDKSNNNLNRRLMGAFQDAIQDFELKELNLLGRKFTWSNDSFHTRIDRAFCSVEWDLMLPRVFLQALSSNVSDHCPLVIAGSSTVRRFAGFRFESFWPRLPGYHDVVLTAWNKSLTVTNPFLRFHIKLKRVSAALRRWAKSLLGNFKVLLRAVSQLIGILDAVQDHRQLSDSEVLLKRDLKVRLLGLTAVEKLRAKQASRLMAIRASEANSKLFFLHANGRRRKNFIHSLHTPDGLFFSHEDVAEFFFDFYSTHFGTPPPRDCTLDWQALGIIQHDLAHLEDNFTEEEVFAVVKELPTEKAPGPDGFIGAFYKSSWGIIKADLLLAIDFFFGLHDQHLGQLNTAHIVLLPKSTDAKEVGDFRPISLIHSMAKLLSKLLSSRLSTELNVLVSRAQSAFIKRRCIHDNFLYTQNIIRALHRNKQPGLFLKLDISKAFDSVRWDYLLEVLEAFGFGSRWRGWISCLLRTSSTSILLNGVQGQRYRHRRGLRQGDPLSPMLFILAMEPLQRLLEVAASEGLLSPIRNRVARLRCSMYADDAAVFINPIKEEIQTVGGILDLFGRVSGLITNRGKCAVFPIRCDNMVLSDVMEGFQCQVKDFPCTYLGLPLHFRQLH
jgi:hypothetical protein